MLDWMIQEENYAQTMDTVVLPYLEARKREFKLKIRGENELSCWNYHADHPEKMVLISHGFTETARKYREVIYYFLIHGYEVYIFEHCGHGFSYRLVEDLSLVHVDHYMRYVRDLLKVASRAVKEHPDLPLTLFGHSMGGGISCAAAGKKPELFQHVILSSPMIKPLTGGVPWRAAKAMAFSVCAAGRAADYVMGYEPYHGPEPFEDSSSLSRARYDYYQSYKASEPMAQSCAPSYGWVLNAVRLNREIKNHSWKNLKMPLVLFQAEDDQMVSNEAQNDFIRLLNEKGGGQGELIPIPGTKHEIFNSENAATEVYWKYIFE